MVVIVNIVRTIINFCLWSNEPEKPAASNNTPTKGYLLYIAPSMLFTMSDTIAYISLSNINPAKFSIIWNCKTAFVAVLYRLFLKRRPMAHMKWAGVGLLLLGPGIAEFGNLMRSTGVVSSGGGGEGDGGEGGGTNGDDAPLWAILLCLVRRCRLTSA